MLDEPHLTTRSFDSHSTNDQFNGLKAGNQIINVNSTYGLPHTISTPMTIESIYGEVIDCKTSPWTEWSDCSKTCGRGIKEKFRQILVYPQNGGKECPQKLLKRRKCKIQSCDEVKKSAKEHKETFPAGEAMMYTENYKRLEERHSRDCVLSEWSPWTPCSATCGLNAVRQRTKDIIQPPGLLGAPCPPRIETVLCYLLPCNY